MGNISSRRRAAKRRSRSPPEDEASRLSPMMNVYGVFIVRFIQIIHDRVLVKNRKRWAGSVVLDLRFPNSEPGRLVAATAKGPADNRNRKEILKKLKSEERSTCNHLDWATFWDFIENRFDQTQAEFERFKLELVTTVNRGQLSMDHIITKANPTVYWPSKDPDMRLIRFQFQFHDFE